MTALRLGGGHYRAWLRIYGASFSNIRPGPSSRAGDKMPAIQPSDTVMSPEIIEEKLRSILQGISVPPQPQIMVDLQMEQLQPYPDVNNIARLISQDPGLSGALLKLVNSPIYGLSNRISSIQHAINLLGTNTVINLINAQAIRGALGDEEIIALNGFWDSAQDIAQKPLRAMISSSPRAPRMA